MNEPKSRCHVCERIAAGMFIFSEQWGKHVKLMICMECVAVGIRWIVRRGREEEDHRAYAAGAKEKNE